MAEGNGASTLQGMQGETVITEALPVVLKEDFRSDGIRMAVFSLATLTFSLLLLLLLSLWLFATRPVPVYFSTDRHFRMVTPDPVNRPWISEADLVQWISTVLPAVFTLDFVNYPVALSSAAGYFTPVGFKKFQAILAARASEKMVTTDRLFVSAHAAGAPIILNQGLLQGEYGWWMQMPLDLSYSSAEKSTVNALVIQVLVVRVPAQDDLKGIRIENIVVRKAEGEQIVASI